MDAERWSARSWLVLVMLLFVAMDLNGVRYGAALLDGAAPAPDAATGRTASIVFGTKGSPHTVYVTARERTIYFLWLGGGFAAFVSGLAIIVGHGVSREMAVRQARLLRLSRAKPRKPSADPRRAGSDRP